ncbi:MAG: 4-coumarate--CoA ligase family protein [Solirubrobacterales bacterium]|nr:4-coumarate--CoA ligase family protein [Solirubrobacterales bacterium]MBV9366671.1 4-coumarate--CoA ligase family protein [Solirubrobacterales bacterium]
MIRSPFPDVEIPDMSLSNFVLSRAGEFGNRAALIDAPSGRTITYAQLMESVRAVAAGLDQRGFRKGEVFAHYTPNLPEYAVAFHAVATVGGVNTTANPLLTVEEFAGQLRDSGARLLVTVPELVEKATAAARQSGVEEIFVYGEAAGATPFGSLLQGDGEPPDVTIDPANDLVALPYSSGTTGVPKGVMLTHRNLVANMCQCTFEQRWAEWQGDRAIAVLPFFHIYGLVVLMNQPLYCGAGVVTMPRFDLREFLRVIQDYRITVAYVVPPIVLALVKHPMVDEFDLSSLELVHSGAAPLSAELELACAERLGCRVRQGYGLTETSPATHFVPDQLVGPMPGDVGPLVPNTECRIVDVLSGEDAPAGESGELLIRGPQVMKGYLNKPQATADAIDPDGWLHTGDIARIDENGSMRIVDRIKELIKYKGYQIAPAELEALLLTHPAITDAAVIPLPDEEAGEVPKAFVVTDGSITPEAVTGYVAEHVAPYKKVRAVEIIDAIPKAPSGKILRRVLIDRERNAAVPG